MNTQKHFRAVPVEELLQIDEILMRLEDYTHGKDGEDITKARKSIAELLEESPPQQLKPGVKVEKGYFEKNFGHLKIRKEDAAEIEKLADEYFFNDALEKSEATETDLIAHRYWRKGYVASQSKQPESREEIKLMSDEEIKKHFSWGYAGDYGSAIYGAKWMRSEIEKQLKQKP